MAAVTVAMKSVAAVGMKVETAIDLEQQQWKRIDSDIGARQRQTKVGRVKLLIGSGGVLVTTLSG